MNLLVSVQNWKLIILAASLSLPLFIIFTGSSITLPENYSNISGIPVHASALLFILLSKNVLLEKKKFIFLILYSSYCVLSFIDSIERFQSTIQIGYFIFGYLILSNLNRESILKLNYYVAIIGSSFIATHALSIALDILKGGDFFTSGTSVFGFTIYQSHLTYPLVITLVLVSVSLSFSNKPILKVIIISMALLIELMLMRRVGFGLFLIYLVFFEPRILVFFVISSIALVLAIVDFQDTYSYLSIAIERLTTITNNGEFTRLMTWERSLERANELDTLLFGNGLNNHSHNLFLHTITTHGLFVSPFFFIPIILFLYNTFKKISFGSKYAIMIIFIVLVDWNLNVNIYQPYYSLMFAFFLISSSTLGRAKYVK